MICLIQKTKEVMQPRLISLLKNIMGHTQSFLGDKYELSRRQFACTSKALQKCITFDLKFPSLTTYEK